MAAGVGSADGKTSSSCPIPTQRGCGANAEQLIHVGWSWWGQAHVQAWSLCSAACPASAAHVLLPKPWQVRLPRSRADKASASSPAGAFTVSKKGCVCFESQACDSDISKAMVISGAFCSTKINKPKEGWPGVR